MEGEGPRAKVWLPSKDGNRPLVFEKVFEEETVKGVDRLVVTTDGSPCELLLDLVRPGGTDYHCLYVKRDSEEEVRHESRSMVYSELSALVDRFRALLESDPSQNFWAYNTATKRQVVLDEHNLMFVYEQLPQAIAWLEGHGFSRGRVSLPTPHIHQYYENSELEAELLRAISR